MEIKLLNRSKCFNGNIGYYSHLSKETATEMKFSVFVPSHAEKRKVPVLYWLSGLTCTEENFMTKAGAQQFAAQHGLMLVAPDTSPRGEGVATSDSWDLGLGAGFYVNATEPQWSKHYRMYDYVSRELPSIVCDNFPALSDRQSISGHSMGGHGALVLGLREPGRYLSVSAFAPICAPTLCPWGQKAFSAYLGSDKAKWAEYDASLLIQKAKTQIPILIDQGQEDKFLKEQLMPEVLQAACAKSNYPVQIRFHAGYDHSYYFISSFIKDHLDFHAKYLNAV